jgi:hypothetical protein
MEVRLVRTRESTRDDRILVRKRMNQEYLVRYTDGTIPNTVWVNSKTESEVLDYIENILTFFELDYDPFIAVQITMSGWPTIYLKQKDVDGDIITRIMDSIEMNLKNTPVSFRV